MKFLKPTRKPNVIYTDDSLEFGESCEELSWNHCTSTPHRSETNGIAERAVRRVRKGTSAVLLQSGLDNEWWADSMQCHCMAEYHTISAKDLSRLHQFGPKVLPGIFLGDALNAGRIWKGDILVTDIEELEEIGASELHARRLNANEVLTPMKGEHVIFPVADGTVKVSAGDQRLRTSTLTGNRPERGEEQEILQGKSDELHSPTHFKKTQHEMMRKLHMISGQLQENSFIVITVNSESNCTCREKKHFLFQ